MKKAPAVALIAATALTLSACSGGGADGADASEAGPLNIGNFSDVTSWDPATADIGFDGPYLSAIYDPLVRVDGDGEPQPALATDWEFSDDKLTLTMNLRDDAEFSDGEAFDADAAVKSLKYLKEGARSKEAYAKVKDIKAVDEDTIEIDLKERDDTILYYMGLGRSFMMAPDAIDDGTLAKEPVGSGPYTMDDSSVAGSEYDFTKVEDHWDSDRFPFSPLTIKPIADETARQNAMDSGQINVNYAGVEALEQAEQRDDWNVTQKVSGWVGLQFTDRTGDDFEPLGKLEVRQALNYAFDGAALLKNLGSGLGEDTNQVWPVGLPGNVPDIADQYKTNLDKAKELLADAGYEDGFKLKMPLTTQYEVWQPAVNEVFGKLGIDVTWDNMQYPDYLTNAPTYPMFIAFISMDANPVATMEHQVTTEQWYNPNPQIDKFPEIEKAVDAVKTADPDDQVSAIEELNKKLVDKAWWSVWYQANNNYITTDNIELTPVTGMMFPTLNLIQPA